MEAAIGEEGNLGGESYHEDSIPFMSGSIESEEVNCQSTVQHRISGALLVSKISLCLSDRSLFFNFACQASKNEWLDGSLGGNDVS